MSDNTPIMMDENERIVREFLREIAPSRKWEYLGEVEHYWIGELCDELTKQLKDENEQLRKELKERPVACDAEVMDFVERLSDAAKKREDVTLFGADYKALPIGADGVSINVGDKGTVHNGNGIHEVKQLVFEGNCWWIGCKMEMASGTVKRMPSSFRHYKPTVENVLREFVTEFNRDDSELCDDEIIERFSKRLQLADGDGDE